jgi:hypothetical protein
MNDASKARVQWPVKTDGFKPLQCNVDAVSNLFPQLGVNFGKKCSLSLFDHKGCGIAQVPNKIANKIVLIMLGHPMPL